ncbi:MAG: ATP-binding protein [Proteobacteria bacterium]|nr:ATP-binding protein [Pseudomonadota bacterium]
MAARNIRVTTSDFANMRNDKAVYVDKTRLIYKMVHDDRAFFLARPRRFGKSLLISVLQAYFEGRRELFDGLAMAELEQDWVQYPVFKFDMSPIHYNTPSDLGAVLRTSLRRYEEIYGRSDEDGDVPGVRFQNLIRRACDKTGQQAVVLIDEYDTPLLDVMHTDQLEPMRDMLQGFYKVLKESTAYLRFVFLTGITKFSQLSIFSALSNLTDITMKPRYASICGITKDELCTELMPEVSAMAEELGISNDALLTQLKHKYDGYHFTKNCPDIYNPFSLMNCLKYRELRNYWYSTGTPTLLTKAIGQYTLRPEDLDNITAGEMELNAPMERADTPITVMYQSGYLTIKNYEYGIYTLGFPNEEVRASFLKGLLPYYANKTATEGVSFITQTLLALRRQQIDRAMELMRSFISSIPYNAERQDEAHYKTIFYLIFRIASEFSVRTEECTSSGRIDALIETEDTIFLFEFKLDGTAEQALQQISDKGYGIPYEAGEKKLIKIGVNFDKELRTIERWIVEM